MCGASTKANQVDDLSWPPTVVIVSCCLCGGEKRSIIYLLTTLSWVTDALPDDSQICSQILHACWDDAHPSKFCHGRNQARSARLIEQPVAVALSNYQRCVLHCDGGVHCSQNKKWAWYCKPCRLVLATCIRCMSADWRFPPINSVILISSKKPWPSCSRRFPLVAACWRRKVVIVPFCCRANPRHNLEHSHLHHSSTRPI